MHYLTHVIGFFQLYGLAGAFQPYENRITFELSGFSTPSVICHGGRSCGFHAMVGGVRRRYNTCVRKVVIVYRVIVRIRRSISLGAALGTR